MRTFGRQNGVWVEVTTDANGNDDPVWLTTLVQSLLLSPGESPFFANYGIPAQQSILTQVYPDFYVAQMQSKFSPYFASLSISRRQAAADENPPVTVYNVDVITNSGVSINANVPI